MKSSTIFTAALTATGVMADPVPTKVIRVRDMASVTSVVAQVSGAVTKLDTSVKAFDGSNINGVQADAQALVSALTSGAATLASSGTLSLTDALGLVDIISPLGPAAQTLVKDVSDKKPQFEKFALCSVVGKVVGDVGTAAKPLVDNIVKRIPEAAQAIAGQVAVDVVDTLTQLAGEFAADKCKDAAVSSSSAVHSSSAAKPSVWSTPASPISAAMSHAASSSTTPTYLVWATPAHNTTIPILTPIVAHPSPSASQCSEKTVMVTVTVTAPCSFETSSVPPPPPPINTPPPVNNTPLPPPPPKNTTTPPTNSTTPPIPIVTAGAVAHGVGSGAIGLVAAFAAAMMLL
ncbi:hydrophobic surface binding protein A-domain-containing protein [Hypomontagnella submonticulosa]|nr:hydrophobic surface binding protein A-domain-containing protein [Hypomontagnella submonticulosa]